MSDRPDDILVGGLPDFKAMLAERERQERERAIERAIKSGLNAYPVAGNQHPGWFSVPSQSELGYVHLVVLDTRTGDPLPLWHSKGCTCPNLKRWCTHAGAARHFYDQARDADDAMKQQEAAAGILHMKERAHDAD